MDDSEDHAGQATGNEILYPEIDEVAQYPWQLDQPSSSARSAIGPSTYRDLFPGSASESIDQSEDDVSLSSGEEEEEEEEEEEVDDSEFVDNDDSDLSYKEGSAYVKVSLSEI